MKILLLAPQPFYQERGTPIAINLMLRSLSESQKQVDLLVFHEGQDVAWPGVTLHRIRPPRWVKDIRPGFSLKKLLCDAYLFFKAWGLIKRQRPDVIHAVEEAVFMAWFFHRWYGIPYVYDMDSSMPDQIVEKVPRAGFLKPVMHSLVRMAVVPCLMVVPVCDALAETAEKYKARCVRVLPDVSLLVSHGERTINLRHQLNLSGTCFMYIGNLEHYQGIDLLLESFALLQRPQAADSLVIIGGNPVDIERYKAKAVALGVGPNVHLLGPQPLDLMAAYMSEADVMVSPRIKGVNTPMKVYSYLDSGKPVLATRLPTHTQVLNDEVAVLAEPQPVAMAMAMRKLADDLQFRYKLGMQGREMIRRHHSYAAYKQSLESAYGQIESLIVNPGYAAPRRVDHA